jgi:sugar O-acyltransferase (sialic acid O-acetyltransferase NeuD family)
MGAAIKVVVLGAGGHAKVLLDMLLENGAFEVAGLLDPGRVGGKIFGRPILGGDDLLPALVRDGVKHFVVGLGSTGVLVGRERLFQLARSHGLRPVNLIHRSATISPSVRLGAGVTVMAAAVVNADARLGDNVCINTAAVVEHDCHIGPHAFVAPGAVLAGGVCVGRLAFVGLGAAVRQGVRIGAGALVGAGAVVVRNVRRGATVAGVPAREFPTHERRSH